ncbi:MAG: bifunctional DNA-formamidopyrimidine glycosylase/DNA-(apurinic or apyrimidinic site) lyase [Terriglobia bacterium]
MPELPEVETVLRGLKKRVLGRSISTVEVSHPQVIVGSPDEFTELLRGREIRRGMRKGKAIALELGPLPGRSAQGRRSERTGRNDGGSRYLLVRLGMTGQFTVNPSAAPVEPHTHVRLALDDGREEIRYRDPRRFGRLRCCTAEELDEIFGGLGPDAPEISRQQFLAALRGRRGPIKSWLMNQQVLAGLGNIYADEALFAAGIHPLSPAGGISVAAAGRLLRAVKDVLRRAVKLQGTSFSDYIDIEGRPGNFLPRLKVYQRTGEPCRRCKRPIQRLVIGGRSSHFCPHCQKQ